MKYAMLIDLRRCIGCRACMLACAQENGAPLDYTYVNAGEYLTLWALGKLEGYNTRVLQVETKGEVKYIPLLCMHCENAPCIAVCPTGASYKAENGIVKINYSRCVGCKMCVAACPYGARYVRKVSKTTAPAGVVDKCNFCAHRVEKGKKPRCVEICPTRCRIFGDLDDPNSDINKALKVIDPRSVKVLKEELGTRPKVFYVGL